MEFLLLVGIVVLIVLWSQAKDKTSKLERRIVRLEAQVDDLQRAGAGLPPADRSHASSPPQPAPMPRPAPMPAPRTVPVPTPAVAIEPAPSPAPPTVSEPVATRATPLPELRSAPARAPVEAAPKRPAPPQPSFLAKLLGENPVVRIGLVVFLLGVSFLVRQIAQAGLFPPEARLAAAALAGVGLLVFGWKSRISRPQFALPLQGGALGVFFLVLFATFRLYHFLPTEVALGVAILLLGLTSTLAVVQNSAALAYLGLAAGFAAPVLLSSGTGSHIGLFSYYALLNAAIFGISWFRSWRTLHVTAFVATYVLGAAWGIADYRPEHFLSCEIFVWVYYALFSGTALLFARRAYRNIFGYVDGTLFFGVPMATLAIQYRLFESDPWPMAWTAVAMAVHHLAMAKWIWSSIRSGKHPHLRVMAETLSVLGVSFASLAIPLAVSGPITALVWAVEGAGLVFLGLRQDRKWSLAMGMLLVLAASAIQASVWNPDPIETAVVAVSLWICAWLVGTRAPWPKEREVLASLLLGWLLIGVVHDAWRIFDSLTRYQLSEPTHLTLAVATGLALLSTLGAKRLRFPLASFLWWPVAIAWFFLVLARGSLLLAGMETSLLSEAGWMTHLAFVPCLATGLYLIRRGDLQGDGSQDALQSLLLHGLLWQGFVWSWDAAGNMGGDWSPAMGLLAVATPLFLVGLPGSQAFLARLSPRLYASAWLSPWWIAVAGLVTTSLFFSASSGTLPWIPVLNPLDLAALLGLLALMRLPAGVTSWSGGRLPWQAICLALGLAWTGSTLDRFFHHYAGLAWDLESLWESRALQAGWSLLMTTQALALMLLAARRRLRLVWMVGAAILGVAVLKLFLVDLSGHSAVARIVSFLGMGVLMVAIGYISPLPPAEAPSEGRSIPKE